jgi:hypothetical protein
MTILNKEVTELTKIIKSLVRETVLRPAQNFSSRCAQPGAEINTRVSGDFKTVSLVLLGIHLLLIDPDEETDDLSFWSILSNFLEHSPTFTLLQNAKIQMIFCGDEELMWENIFEENYFGNTSNEIFGYVLDPQRKKDIQESYRLYLIRPKTPKRVQRHRGYRDKGSLPGDKKYLESRNFNEDCHRQLLREQYRSYQYTFKELKEIFWGRTS